MRSSNFNSRERVAYAGDSSSNNNSSSSSSSSSTLSHYQRRLGPLSTPLLTDDPSNPDRLQKRIRIYSILLLLTSIFFWSWAMYNTRHLRRTNVKALDLGIVSFFGTALSSLCMLRMAYGGTLFFCCKRRGKIMTTNNEQNDGYYLEGHRKSSRDVVDHSPPGCFLQRFTLMVRTQNIYGVLNVILHLRVAVYVCRSNYYLFVGLSRRNCWYV